MSMNAMAVLGVEWSWLQQTLGVAQAPSGSKTPDGASWLTSLVGGAILVHELDDGVLIDLGHAVGDVEPDELGAALRAHLGPLLDAHSDERGIFIFPEKVRPTSNTIAVIVEEIGELGEWVELPAAAGPPDMPGGLQAMMGQVLGGMDPSQMQGLIAQAQQMMADPAMAEKMMAAAAQMMGGAGGGLDLSALRAQAQQIAQDDPALVERIKSQLAPDDDDDA